MKRRASKSTEVTIVSYSEAELSTNSDNSTSKLDSLDDLALPDFPLEWFTNMGVKHFKHVIERELVVYEFVDFNFFKHAKFSFIEKLENLG